VHNQVRSIDYLKYADAKEINNNTRCYNNWDEYLADPKVILEENELKLKGRPSNQ